MKVLLIDNSSIVHVDEEACIYGATGEFALELKRHHQVTLYGQILRSVNSISKFGLLKHGLKYVGVWRRKSKLITYLLLYLRVIPEIIKADFVYIFYPSALKYTAVLCWLLLKPYGIYVRGEKGITNNSSKFIYQKSKVIFTVTEYFTAKINAITNSNVHTIRPMIPFTEKDVVYRVVTSAPQSNEFNILFLARMDKEKGIEELLYSIKKLKERKNDVFLTIVGDGGHMPHVRSLVEELDINEFVSIKGVIHDRSEIRRFYLGADIYILPTYHEGFPRTLYEAMIFGTPIITTLVGGIPSLMKDKVNCLEIEPRSVQSIVEQLQFAIENPEVVGRLAVNARELVCEIVDSRRLTHAEHLHNIISK